MAEYWRWWVVHLWVEGFFEVFATVVIAFLFARLELVRPAIGGRGARCSSSTIFLAGGIIGTLHHLYFSGTPTVVARARARSFSALEVVPLLFVGLRGRGTNLRAVAPRAVGAQVPVADLLLRRRRVLEPGRRRPVRLHDQPADRALLHAGPEHDARARPRARSSASTACSGIGLMLFCLRALTADRDVARGAAGVRASGR